jgi:hypothetical protein
MKALLACLHHSPSLEEPKTKVVLNLSGLQCHCPRKGSCLVLDKLQEDKIKDDSTLKNILDFYI